MSNELATTTNNVATSIIPDGPFSTVDTTTFDGAKRVTNAINNSESLNDYVRENNNPTMTVVDIVVTNGMRKARDGGDDTPCEDTRLILADGTSLLSQSGGIAKCAKMIAGFCGSELHNGLLIRVVARELRNGNTIKNLEVVGKA